MRSSLSCALLSATLAFAAHAQAPSQEGCREAAEFSARNRGLALLVQHDGRVAFEEYRNGWSRGKANHIYSGTKSFCSVLALVLQERGLLRLDEKVADTITEWKGQPRKAQVTIRQLLDFTSGLGRTGDRGGIVNNPDFYGIALRGRVRTWPGRRWAYGSTSLHVFGELVQRKLRAHAQEHPGTPTEIVAYLKQHLLDPIGCQVDDWIRDGKGQAALAFGAFLTARDWARFGQLILQQGRWGDRQLVPAKALAQCFEGSKAKHNYGLNWWLVGKLWHRRYPEIPEDTVAAVGLFGQKLYVIPSRKLVVVRFGPTGGALDIDDRGLLRPLLEPEAPRRAKL